MQPCNKGFVNTWKSASYCASFVSAIVVIIANRLGSDVFPQSSLLPALLGSWACLILLFAYIYYMWYQKNRSHYHYLDQLVEYPFYWRDKKIKVAKSGGDPDLVLCFNEENKLKISLSGENNNSESRSDSVSLGIYRFRDKLH